MGISILVPSPAPPQAMTSVVSRGSRLRAALRRSLPLDSARAAASHSFGHAPRCCTSAIAACGPKHGRNLASSFSTLSQSQNEQESILAQSLHSDILALERLYSLLSTDSALIDAFEAVVERLDQCRRERRCIFVTGMGKSGIVARRLAATLASISVRSQWIHGSEWSHGDLGNLEHGDVAILFSHSGTTSELLPLPAYITRRGGDTVAVVGQANCAIARLCSYALIVPADDHPNCPVPSRSIIAQEAICNAIVESFIDLSEKGADAFRVNHPGGAIGDGFAKE